MRYNKQELIALASQTSQNFDREGVLILKERQDGFFRRSVGCSVRWFRLRGNLLFYLKGPEPWYEPTGVIVLGNHQVSVQTQDENGHWPFQIVWENGVCYRIATFHESERVLWLKAIENAPYEQYSRKIADLQKQLNETRPMIDITMFRVHNCIQHDINEVPICEMALSCDNLLCDSQGNPPSTFLAIYVFYPTGEFVRYDCTESVEKCSNPSFCRTIQFRTSDLINEESMVRIAVHDVREAVTRIGVIMGSTCMKLNIIQEAQRLRIPLVGHDDRTIGFLTINGWSLKPVLVGSPTHKTNESVMEDTAKILSHRCSQSLPVRLGRKLMYPAHSDIIRFNFLNPHHVTYQFQSGLGGDITVHEVMAEPRFCYSLPIQILEIFILREKELLATLLPMTDMPEVVQSRQSELVNVHMSLLRLYIACQKTMKNMTGCYKPSCRKEEIEFSFAPVNLHMQQMWVHNDTLNKTGAHAVVTVGAFTSYTQYSEKDGGLIKLVQQMKDSYSGKEEMTANTNRLNAEYEKVVTAKLMRDEAIVNMDKTLVAMRDGNYHMAAFYNDGTVTNVKRVLSLWDGPAVTEAVTKIGWCSETRSQVVARQPSGAVNKGANAGEAAPPRENPDSASSSLPEGSSTLAGASGVENSGASSSLPEGSSEVAGAFGAVNAGASSSLPEGSSTVAGASGVDNSGASSSLPEGSSEVAGAFGAVNAGASSSLPEGSSEVAGASGADSADASSSLPEGYSEVAGALGAVNASASSSLPEGSSTVAGASGVDNSGASSSLPESSSEVAGALGAVNASASSSLPEGSSTVAGASGVDNSGASSSLPEGSSEVAGALGAVNASASSSLPEGSSTVAGASGVDNSGASSSLPEGYSEVAGALDVFKLVDADAWVETGTMDYAGAIPALAEPTARSSSSSRATTPTADIATTFSASVPDMQNEDTELQFHLDHFKSERDDQCVKSNHSQHYRQKNRKNGRKDRNNRNANSFRSGRGARPKQNAGNSFERHGSLKNDSKSSVSTEQVSFKSLVRIKKEEKKKIKKAMRDAQSQPRPEIDPVLKARNEEFYNKFILSVEEAVFSLDNKINAMIVKDSLNEEDFDVIKDAMELVVTKLEKTYKSMSLTHAAMRLHSELPAWTSEYTVLQVRRDTCFVQALTALVTGLISWLNITSGEIIYKLLTSGVGPLCGFEGLLTLYGAEKSMWGDMVVAVEDLQTVVFRLVKITPDSFKTPLVVGTRDALAVELPVSEALYDRFRKDNKTFTITTVFFNVGINEKAGVAEALAETKPQHLSNIDNLEKLTKYYVKYTEAFPNEPLESMKGSSRSESLEEVLETLRAKVEKHQSKNVEVLQLASLATRLMNGVRFTSCKSAKDRTGMSVTLEQVNILSSEYHLADHARMMALNVMRSNGCRRENTIKNIGLDKYAFNKKQLNSLPEDYRPPIGSYGASFT